MRNIPNPKCNCIQINTFIFNLLHRLSISLSKLNPSTLFLHIPLVNFPSSKFQHFLININDSNLGSRIPIELSSMFKKTKCNIPRSTSDIKDFHLRIGAAGVECSDEMIFPETMGVEGHCIVHGIVFSGY